MYLRNGAILTEGTLQIATSGAKGESPAAGEEVKERFFFDRVKMQGGNFAVVLSDQCMSIVIAAHAASSFSFFYMAEVRAERTDDLLSLWFCIQGLVHFVRILLVSVRKILNFSLPLLI